MLVVEDDPQVRAYAAQVLRSLGYRTVEAGTAREALDRLDTEPELSLLFTDLVLPGGESGLDLARQVARRRPGLPVLYASGYSEDLIDEAMDLEILKKPYRRQQLAQSVATALHAAGLREASGS